MRNSNRHILSRLLGWFFLILGVIGIFLPFLQGFIFIFIGLSLLSFKHDWVKQKYEKFAQKYPNADAFFQKYIFNKLKK